MKRVSRSRWIGALVVALPLAALGFVPIFAGPTYESALAAGFLCPSVAAVVTSREIVARELDGFGCFARAVANGVGLVLVAYLVALAHGLRAGFCDAIDGTLLFALGPGVGTVLAGVWGAVAAELARRIRGRRLSAVGSVALALALPIGSILLGLSLFYATPAVFAFDPFVGYFSGALYDTVLHDTGLWTYRAASAATLFACYVASLHLERGARGRLVPRSLGRPGLLVAGALAAMGSLASVAGGSELGHWQTAGTIERALGAEIVEGRCRLVYDRSIDREAAERLVHDCDGHITQIAAWLELSDPPPVTAYLFRDVDRKRRLMGAARTSIAKPWRREIYIHERGYPHGVLGHELVHALGSEVGHGPFGIAGSLGGLLPNPGLVEGLATAASPHDDELTADEWAAAMRRIEVLPRLDRLFSLGFFGEASSTSYTAAGSFVGFVRERFGPATVVRWYGGGDVTELTGQGWEALERAWWEALDGLELSDAALATAKARFDRPGVLARRCPHEVDEQLALAASREGTGDVSGAIESYRDALALDPDNVHALLGIASCHERLDELQAARAQLTAVTESELHPQAIKSGALERLGDLALRRGEAAEARARYAEARASITSEDRLRTLDIKSHYADQPAARAALLALLVGTTSRGPDETEALDRIGRWRADDEADGTPDYLFARQHLARERYTLAAERLDRALERGLPVLRAEVEALRLRLIAACALGEAAAAQTFLERYQQHPAVSHARVRIAAALVERCGR